MALAWAVEIMAVVMGLVLAAFAGFEGSDGGLLAVIIATLPFAALSIIELTKLPLIGLAFRVRSTFWLGAAIVALLFVTAATFENFVFGFERGFNERIRAVELAEQDVRTRESAQQIAQARLPQLTAQQADLTARLAALRDEAADLRKQAQEDIADTRANDGSAGLRAQREQLERELATLDQRRDAALGREHLRCASNPGLPCNVAALLGSYQRQRDGLTRRIAGLAEQQRAREAAAVADVAGARQKRDAGLADRDRERGLLQGEIEAVRRQIAEAQAIALQSGEAMSQAVGRRDAAIEKSQLHRLSMVLFGSHDRGTLEWTKRCVVVSLAAIVALIGSVIAALHHAAQQPAETRRRPLVNAIRAYLARRRRSPPILRDMRAASRQRQGLMRNLRGYFARRRRSLLPVVTREVVREVPVDRLKLVYLPLDASEERVAAVRREARQEAA